MRTNKNIKTAFLGLIATGNILFAQSLNDAIKLTSNEQFEAADAVLKQLVQATPTNGDNYFYLGENYFKWENIDEAKKAYQKGAEINPTNGLNIVGLGKVLWVQKNANEAKANFYKATALSQSKNANVLINIAEAYLEGETKSPDDAIAMLTQATKLDAKNPEIYILMGDAYLEKNDGSKAIENYEKATSLNPKSSTATLRVGKLYARARNYNLALDYYKKANGIDSTFAPAYREMAELYAKAAKPQVGVQMYKKYLALNNSLSARDRYASFLFLSKDYKNAITEIKEVQKKDSSSLYLYRIIAYCQFETGDYTEGIKNIEKFFSRAGNNFKLISSDYEYHGKLLSKNGKDSLAIVKLNEAIANDTSRTDLYGDIGSVYLKMKKYPEAIASYEKKIAVGKANANDYFSMGRAALFAKDYTKADTSFATAIKANPDYPVVYLWRAKAAANQDSKNEKWLAKPYYETFIQKVKPEETEKYKKDLIEAYEYLGYYSVVKKDYATAKQQFGKVKELDPNNKKQKDFFNSKEGQ